MSSQPQHPTVRPDEIFIDQQILILAGLDKAEREEWTEWAGAVLFHAERTGEWLYGHPLVTDRSPARGPDGERYALVGFSEGLDGERCALPGFSEGPS